LLNRDFVLLWQAQLVSQFGNQAFTIAMMFWTAEVTGSATMSGLMLMAGVLPVVLLAPLTGTFVDRRRSRRRIIVTCDLISGALVSLLALGFLSGAGEFRPGLLFTVALLVGTCHAFLDPAVNAFVPDLVPGKQIEAANAFRESSRQATVLTAQGFGGILYVLVGPPLLFLLDGLSFLFAGASEMMIRPDRRDGVWSANDAAPRPPSPPFFALAADGFRYMAAQPGLVGFLVATSVFNALLMPMSVLLPVYATVYLHADVRWYGFLLAAINAGAIGGCTLVGARNQLSGPGRRIVLLTAFASLAVTLALLGQIQSRWIALAIACATGVLTGIINVIVMSIIQRRTSAEFRGRVIGLHAMMTRVLVPIGLVGGGVVADLTGRNVPLVFGVCSALALTSVILLGARRNTRAFLASE
jgi:MFS family permease